MASGIYAIVSPSGKRYVGSAVNISRRWTEHQRRLQDGTHDNRTLQNSYNKYGSALVYTVLELCEGSREVLLSREQHYIDTTPPESLYNQCLQAGSVQGLKHTAATRTYLRNLHTGRKHTKEARANMAKAAKGRLRTAKHNANLGASNRGRQRSAESKARMSAARNTSGYPGVTFSKQTGKWLARAFLSGKTYHLGSFASAELANAYRLYRLAIMGADCGG